MKSWMRTELDHLNLGDKRRSERFRKIVETAVAHPTASIPQAQGNWPGTKATYRFWGSAQVTPQKLLAAMGAATARRATDHPTVLLIQDTSNINFSGSPAAGLGYLDHGKAKGILAHSSLAVSPEGVPLGIVGQHLWVRPPEQLGIAATRSQRAIEDKESWRWIQGLQDNEAVMGPGRRLIHIADREADIFDLLACPRQPGADLLIRATHNRCIADGKRLWDHLAAGPRQGTMRVELQKADGRPARTASLELRWQQVDILPPARAEPHAPVLLQALLVSEPAPPKGAAPICWKLLTTLPITGIADALGCVQWYTQRWLIERFHFVLKSGCHVEALQLRSLESLKNALVTYSLVAYRLMWLLYESRRHPDGRCDQILDLPEWKALYSYHHKTFAESEQCPTLEEAVRWIAMLGGFLNRKGDGNPGIKNLWRGMRRLQDLAELWIIFENGSYQQPNSYG